MPKQHTTACSSQDTPGVNNSSSPAWQQKMLADWRAMARSADPLDAQVGRNLLAAWKTTRRADEHTDEELPPALWAEHLAELTDPPTRSKDPQHYQTGHSQMHASSSGTCLWVNLDWGRWGCRSCHQGGDVVWWVAFHQGVTRSTAWLILRRQFGDPGAH